jgi:hypothetical protein
LTATDSIEDSTCRGLVTKVSLSRPAGTGDDLLDGRLALELLGELRSIRRTPPDSTDPSECPSQEALAEGAEIQRIFEVHSPSKGILSIAYQMFSATPLAVHPNTTFESYNHSLAQGRPLKLGDLFPGEDAPAAVLWAVVAPKWCAYNDYRSLPSFYGFDPEADLCAKPKEIPLPAALVADPDSLAALGNAYLTEDGLMLRLAAYDGWSYADGPSALLVGKDELVAVGADKTLWR